MSRSRRQKDKSMSRFTGTETLSGQHFNTRIGNDFNKGHRGMALAVKGAKKFINSCCRFHEVMALHEIKKDGE